MICRLVISSEARSEISDARRWYERQCEGLGQDFINILDSCFTSIQQNPKMYSIVYRNIRRAHLRRFPYGVFYFLDKETIVVLAVFHASRNPQQWRKRT